MCLRMNKTVWTPLKGIALLIAVFLAFYPVVLVVQLFTGTVTESIGQIAALLVLSLLTWAWLVRLYRNTEFGRVGMVESE